MIETHPLPILSDNYAYILKADNGDVAVIDPGNAAPVLDFLSQNNLTPTHIFLTHHHGDHIAGTQEIKDSYSCPVYGPVAEAQKIGCLDHTLTETSVLSFGAEPVQIIETPGHTLGQINFYFPESALLFSGDTLFVMGCGRVFEGTMAQMHHSLQKLAALPDDTQVYCGHEYTLANAEFCLAQAPSNVAIKARHQDIKTCRAANRPTIPSSIKLEKATNLFLTAKNEADFAALRTAKDNF